MARDLVLFLDGTNNTLTGRRTDTNVLRLFERLSARHEPEQMLYYDPGVGSPDFLPWTGLDEWFSRKWERLSALASGRGVFENIGQAYMFIAREYHPGDRVWLFGFSRGAFTTRSVSGMINLFGIIRPEHEVLLPTLLRVYFTRVGGQGLQIEAIQQGAVDTKPRTREAIARQIRESFTNLDGRSARVHFVGVWDTVAAVGLPPFALRISSRATVRDKRVNHVRHALALDEHRRSFEPRLYSEDNFGTENEAQSLKQLWFRGAHGDVGGGYPPVTSGLSDQALAWMVDEARACGLRCDPANSWLPGPNAERWVHDPIHEMALWAVAGMGLRNTALASGTADRGAPLAAVAHPSAHEPPEHSVWQLGRGVVPAVALIVAALVAAVLSGAQLSPLQAGAFLHPRRALEMLSAYGRSNGAAALGFDVLFMIAYAALLARPLTWAFARAAGWRQAGDPVPWVSWLGLALPVMLAGDAAENALGLIALAVGHGWLGAAALWLGSLGSLVKLVGALGCAWLFLWGWLKPRRPQL